jgi:DNA-binding SARP family transcriptional activator
VHQTVAAPPCFYLLGKFEARWGGGEPIRGLKGRKLQELVSFLLVFRDRPHLRETVAELIWGENNQSRKYLRQAIWQLQHLVHGHSLDKELLTVSPEWIQLNQSNDAQIDVAELDAAFACVKDKRSDELAEDDVAGLERAADLYKGELLEGFYQDWCVFERQRVKVLYLRILESLLDYYEMDQRLEDGLHCALRLLREEPAHERTHCRVMRLHYLAGDRTLAIRQFQSCVAFLRDELGVEPAEGTMALYEQIRGDHGPRTPSRQPVPQETTSGPIGLFRPLGAAPADLKMAVANLHEAKRLVSTALAVIAARSEA